MIKTLIITFIKRFSIPAIVLLTYVLVSLIWLDDYTNCLFKMVTGFPCVTCGMSRAFLSIPFNFSSSFYYHPLWPLVIIIVIVLFFEPTKFGRKIAHSKLFWISILLIFLITYIVRMIYIYPNYPLDYEPRNLFLWLLNK